MNLHPLEINEFATCARAFIVWCETSHAGDTAETFLIAALQHLANVYSAALKLPHAQSPNAPDPPKVTLVKRALIAKNLSVLPFQYYWEVLNSSKIDSNKDPVCGDLFDDFLDIRRVLTDGLWLHDQGYVEAAVFTWRLTFRTDWGCHAVSAMHALHSYDPG